MSEKVEFSVRINGGPIQKLETLTGTYLYAAVAALAHLPFEDNGENHVLIWSEKVLAYKSPDDRYPYAYGPYCYVVTTEKGYLEVLNGRREAYFLHYGLTDETFNQP